MVWGTCDEGYEGGFGVEETFREGVAKDVVLGGSVGVAQVEEGFLDAWHSGEEESEFGPSVVLECERPQEVRRKFGKGGAPRVPQGGHDAGELLEVLDGLAGDTDFLVLEVRLPGPPWPSHSAFTENEPRKEEDDFWIIKIVRPGEAKDASALRIIDE